MCQKLTTSRFGCVAVRLTRWANNGPCLAAPQPLPAPVTDGVPGPGRDISVSGGKRGAATSSTSGGKEYRRTAAPRVTLRDVAERAGVSRTTASFVTTGRRDMGISAQAEERVNKAARELGYRPSLLARGLRTNLSQTIGLISDVVATEP